MYDKKKYMQEYHKKRYVKKGYTLKGEKANAYTTGSYFYKTYIKETCEFCDLNTEHLCVHHIDEDRYNNIPDNLATLCRSCHIIVHGVLDRRDKTTGRFTKKE